MENISFSLEEKIKLFDEICSHFYNHNFGLMSKVDMEMMMFQFYIEKLISDHKNADGTIDYKACSDYKISKELGITQQRVRNLKVKYQLAHPIEFNWKNAFDTLVSNARYDNNGKIVMDIPDPNLFLEIQNYIEERGGYVENQRNGRILQLRVEYFLELAMERESDEKRKEIVQSLKKQFKKDGKAEKLFDEKHIAKSLIETSANITTIAANISCMLSPGNVLGMALAKWFSAS